MRKAVGVGVGKLVISVISILILRIYSDKLTLSEIGLVALLMNFESFFGLVYASPFGNYLSLTALSDLRNKTIGHKIVSYTRLTFLSSLFSFFIFFVYLQFFDFKISFLLTLLYILYLFLNNATPIISSLLAVINRTESSLVLQVIKSVSGIVSFLIVFSFVNGVPGWILGSFAGILLPALINFIYYRRVFHSGNAGLFSFKGFITKKTLVNYILPYSLMQLALWFFFSSYRIYAGKLFSLDFLGQLVLVFTFASQCCSAFDSVITQIYLADFYRLMDSTPEEDKLKNFGAFLKKVQPVYMSFFVLGFLPFIIFFKLLIKPADSPDGILLLAAWLFNFARISFNLFGLITQVILNPKIVTRFTAIGVGISIFIFAILYGFKIPVSRDVFLVIIAAIPIVVIIFFIRRMGKWLGQETAKAAFILNFIVCTGITLLFLNNDLLFFVLNSHLVLLLGIVGLLLSFLGVRMLLLSKKLKEI